MSTNGFVCPNVDFLRGAIQLPQPEPVSDGPAQRHATHRRQATHQSLTLIISPDIGAKAATTAGNAYWPFHPTLTAIRQFYKQMRFDEMCPKDTHLNSLKRRQVGNLIQAMDKFRRHPAQQAKEHAKQG